MLRACLNAFHQGRASSFSSTTVLTCLARNVLLMNWWNFLGAAGMLLNVQMSIDELCSLHAEVRYSKWKISCATWLET